MKFGKNSEIFKDEKYDKIEENHFFILNIGNKLYI